MGEELVDVLEGELSVIGAPVELELEAEVESEAVVLLVPVEQPARRRGSKASKNLLTFISYRILSMNKNAPRL